MQKNKQNKPRKVALVLCNAYEWRQVDFFLFLCALRMEYCPFLLIRNLISERVTFTCFI